MATYVIGDLQGCYEALQLLLQKVSFEPTQDTLMFSGDLVNRGPQSLEVLRFVKTLPHMKIVLGNHDLHLLAIHFGRIPSKKKDTLRSILEAPDREELLQWLRRQSLCYVNQDENYALVHAGIANMWTLQKAEQLSREVEMLIQSEEFVSFAPQMYGNTPALWQEDLQGVARYRCIINYFTRMRYCYKDGRLDFDYKGPIAKKPENLIPWFQLPERKSQNSKIFFGHWAAIGGVTNQQNLIALDTGCVWGNRLTAIRLEDMKRFHVDCGFLCNSKKVYG